jgi:hypothetical protein
MSPDLLDTHHDAMVPAVVSATLASSTPTKRATWQSHTTVANRTRQYREQCLKNRFFIIIIILRE